MLKCFCLLINFFSYCGITFITFTINNCLKVLRPILEIFQ